MLSPARVKQDVYYKIVDHNVAHEIIDGEVIIIHFDTGNYYSLEGVAAQMWQWFASQASRQQILDAFQDLEPREIQNLDEFIDFLVKEELLMTTETDAEYQPASPFPKHEVPFEPPKFSKYNDMQILLMSNIKPDVHYKIVDHKVTHETIDGEVIIIHFDSGNYYSLEGVASQMWQWFGSRASRQQILDAFQDLQPRQIQHLDEFIDFLLKEELLMITEPGAESESPSTSSLPKHEVPFQSPKYTKYNDMQVLLMSDPLHDVDETGWPNLEEDKV